MKLPTRMAFVFFIALSCLMPMRLAALEIFSVSPVKTYSGQTVRVTGGPFSKGVKVYLGDVEIAPRSVDEREINFEVPDLTVGEYILFLRYQDQESPHFRLEIIAEPPIVYSVNPPDVDECGLDQMENIEIQGDHFLKGAIVLLDGKVTASTRLGMRLIALPVGTLRGGNHQLQVVNPDGRQSLPQGLAVNDSPEIYSVVPGEDRVNSYELIIDGKNFVQRSQLLVNGRTIQSVSGIPNQTGLVRYVDCHTLIYERYPHSREVKQLSFRIVNPNGKQTPLFIIAAP